jgi:hypothetical protein
MPAEANRSRIEPHWHVFDETTAWLAHCEAVEASIARDRLRRALDPRANA